MNEAIYYQALCRKRQILTQHRLLMYDFTAKNTLYFPQTFRKLALIQRKSLLIFGHEHLLVKIIPLLLLISGFIHRYIINERSLLSIDKSS